MGEYAIRKSDGESIKIGTCESMYYLRYEDRFKVTPEEGSGFGYYWRLPFPDEDCIRPGEYDSCFRGIELTTGTCVGDNGEDEEFEFRPISSDYDNKAPYHLVCIREEDGVMHPVVNTCKDQWYRESWLNVLPHINDEGLKERLQTYAHQSLLQHSIK
jgi:hypothetical protein